MHLVAATCELQLGRCERSLKDEYQYQFMLLVALIVSLTMHCMVGLYSLRSTPPLTAYRSSQTDEVDIANDTIPFIVINPGDHVQMAFETL